MSLIQHDLSEGSDDVTVILPFPDIEKEEREGREIDGRKYRHRHRWGTSAEMSMRYPGDDCFSSDDHRAGEVADEVARLAEVEMTANRIGEIRRRLQSYQETDYRDVDVEKTDIIAELVADVERLSSGKRLEE